MLEFTEQDDNICNKKWCKIFKTKMLTDTTYNGNSTYIGNGFVKTTKV